MLPGAVKALFEMDFLLKATLEVLNREAQA
ncbi:MAG: hypothetical protein ACJA13_002131 [Paraglaciecola sp.]|jgi:hypothetical protein